MNYLQHKSFQFHQDMERRPNFGTKVCQKSPTAFCSTTVLQSMDRDGLKGKLKWKASYFSLRQLMNCLCFVHCGSSDILVSKSLRKNQILQQKVEKYVPPLLCLPFSVGKHLLDFKPVCDLLSALYQCKMILVALSNFLTLDL